jgi:hypothetical protein
MRQRTRQNLTLGVALGGLASGGLSLLLDWQQSRVHESVVLAPLAWNLDTEERVLRFEFSIANNGDREARLVELCLVPRPWLGAYWPDGSGTGIIRDVVDGVPWLLGGEPHPEIMVSQDSVVSAEIAFGIAQATKWIEFTGSDSVRLEIWATVLNHSGSHTGQVEIDLRLSSGNPQSWGLRANGEVRPTELLPGYGSFPHTDIPGLCRFMFPVFGPTVSV